MNSKYPRLYARYQLLHEKDDKTELEVAEFEHLSHLNSLIDCINAFEDNIRTFSRKKDRDEILFFLKKAAKNFEHNEGWLEDVL